MSGGESGFELLTQQAHVRVNDVRKGVTWFFHIVAEHVASYDGVLVPDQVSE